MTEVDPNVLCVSFFDNGPVHMLTTIHKSAEFITIHRRRWDGKELKIVELPIERLEEIHDYNTNMNNVDIFDQCEIFTERDV